MNTPAVATTLVEVTEKLPIQPPARIFFKNEYQQPSGSFKLRGIGNLVGHSITEARELGKMEVEVFSSSGGNAGLAAAYASRHYGVPCTVVLPTTSKPEVIEKLKELGARVEVHGAHWGEADSYLKNHLIKATPSSTYPVYCHPFDDPIVWQGHATMIDEIVEQLDQDKSRIKGVVCSVGGGGLYNGIVEGLKRHDLHFPVLALETKQAPTFHKSVEADKIVHLDNITTLATSLASPYLSEKSLQNFKTHPTSLLLLDDKDALQGTLDLYDNFGILVEPACGLTASLAFSCQDQLTNQFGDLSRDQIIVFIICGGSATNLDTLEEYRRLVNMT